MDNQQAKMWLYKGTVDNFLNQFSITKLTIPLFNILFFAAYNKVQLRSANGWSVIIGDATIFFHQRSW